MLFTLHRYLVFLGFVGWSAGAFSASSELLLLIIIIIFEIKLNPHCFISTAYVLSKPCNLLIVYCHMSNHCVQAKSQQVAVRVGRTPFWSRAAFRPTPAPRAEALVNRCSSRSTENSHRIQCISYSFSVHMSNMHFANITSWPDKSAIILVLTDMKPVEARRTFRAQSWQQTKHLNVKRSTNTGPENMKCQTSQLRSLSLSTLTQTQP